MGTGQPMWRVFEDRLGACAIGEGRRPQPCREGPPVSFNCLWPCKPLPSFRAAFLLLAMSIEGQVLTTSQM
jgi:hypothetical protein